MFVHPFVFAVSDQALELKPENIQSYVIKAGLFIDLNRLAEALSTVQKGLQYRPRNPTLRKIEDEITRLSRLGQGREGITPEVEQELFDIFMNFDDGPASSPVTNEITVNNTKIAVFVGDITRFPSEAVILGVNTQMNTGKGVTGAIIKALVSSFGEDHKKAQNWIFPKPETVVGRKKFELESVQSVPVDGLDAPAGWHHVISAIYHNLPEEAPESHIINTIVKALQHADLLGVKSVTLPAFGTGVVNISFQESANLMFEAIQIFLRNNPETVIENITIVIVKRDSAKPFILKLNTLGGATDTLDAPTVDREKPLDSFTSGTHSEAYERLTPLFEEFIMKRIKQLVRDEFTSLEIVESISDILHPPEVIRILRRFEERGIIENIVVEDGQSLGRWKRNINKVDEAMARYDAENDKGASPVQPPQSGGIDFKPTSGASSPIEQSEERKSTNRSTNFSLFHKIRSGLRYHYSAFLIKRLLGPPYRESIVELTEKLRDRKRTPEQKLYEIYDHAETTFHLMDTSLVKLFTDLIIFDKNVPNSIKWVIFYQLLDRDYLDNNTRLKIEKSLSDSHGEMIEFYSTEFEKNLEHPEDPWHFSAMLSLYPLIRLDSEESIQAIDELLKDSKKRRLVMALLLLNLSEDYVAEIFPHSYIKGTLLPLTRQYIIREHLEDTNIVNTYREILQDPRIHTNLKETIVNALINLDSERSTQILDGLLKNNENNSRPVNGMRYGNLINLVLSHLNLAVYTQDLPRSKVWYEANFVSENESFAESMRQIVNKPAGTMIVTNGLPTLQDLKELGGMEKERSVGYVEEEDKFYIVQGIEGRVAPYQGVERVVDTHPHGRGSVLPSRFDRPDSWPNYIATEYGLTKYYEPQAGDSRLTELAPVYREGAPDEPQENFIGILEPQEEYIVVEFRTWDSLFALPKDELVEFIGFVKESRGPDGSRGLESEISDANPDYLGNEQKGIGSSPIIASMNQFSNGEENFPGGIDMNPNNLDLQTQGSRFDLKLPVDSIDLQNIRIDGFTPVIINVAPLINLPLLLGLVEEEEETENVRITPGRDPMDHRMEYDEELVS